MRLAIFVICIGSLILVSRWYTLSGKSAKDTDSQVEASDPAESLQVPQMVVEPIATAHATSSWSNNDTPSHNDSVVGLKFEKRHSTLGSNARNIQQLVRAEYELPREAAGTLMNLKPNVVLEIEEIDSEDTSFARLQVTTDADTQRAVSKFLFALFPVDVTSTQRRRSFEQPVEGELAAQSTDCSVALPQFE